MEEGYTQLGTVLTRPASRTAREMGHVVPAAKGAPYDGSSSVTTGGETCLTPERRGAWQSCSRRAEGYQHPVGITAEDDRHDPRRI
jgi:hypothetical protein